MSAPIEYSQSFKDAVKSLESMSWHLTGSGIEELFRLFVPRVDFDGVEAERRRLHERCKRLEIAAAPFANLDIEHKTGRPDSEPVFGINDTSFNLGNIRRLRQALRSDSEDKK